MLRLVRISHRSDCLPGLLRRRAGQLEEELRVDGCDIVIQPTRSPAAEQSPTYTLVSDVFHNASCVAGALTYGTSIYVVAFHL